MKKQIISIAMVLVLVVVAFTSCSKKYVTYTDNEGATHYLVTDKEGNTILNDKGQLVAGVTDDSGKLVTVEGGEFETRIVDFPDYVVSGSVYETPYFTMTLPENRWGIDNNTLVMLNTSIKIDISFFEMQEDDTISNVFNTEYNKLKSIAVDPEYSKVVGDYGTKTVTFENSGNRVAYGFYADMKDESGTIIEHREVYYFECGDRYYKLLCIAPAQEADKVSFPDVVNMIKFK